MKHEFDKGMRELNKYKKKKVIEGKVKPQAEVLAFGAYIFESLQSFNNSQVKAHSMFSLSNLQLICQNCRTLPLAYVTNLQSLLRGQLNRYRYIFDINRYLTVLPASRFT